MGLRRVGVGAKTGVFFTDFCVVPYVWLVQYGFMRFT